MAPIPNPDPPLGDGVVALRPWSTADIPAQLVAFADPLFTQFTSWAPGNEVEARRYLFEREAARLGGRQLELAIVEPHDATVLLGGVSLNRVSIPDHQAAVGYWLAPEARGRGVATRSLKLLMGYAFDTLGIERLELTCGPDNERSMAVAARCGFTREGIRHSDLPIEGARGDSVVFSRRREDSA